MIPAVVLAAGRSSRMGRPKAILPLRGGETFLARIVRTFHDAGVDDVVVVVGHDAATVISESGLPEAGPAPRGVRFVVNPAFEQGQLSSVVAGIGAVERPGVAGVLLTLVDVPLVSAATVRAVLDHRRRTGAPVVRPASGTRHGHPVFLARELFDALRQADPREGAKAVVRAHASAAGNVPIDDEGAFTDVDTPEEYQRIVAGGA